VAACRPLYEGDSDTHYPGLRQCTVLTEPSTFRQHYGCSMPGPCVTTRPAAHSESRTPGATEWLAEPRSLVLSAVESRPRLTHQRQTGTYRMSLTVSAPMHWSTGRVDHPPLRNSKQILLLTLLFGPI
jgi:hypothetical protein